MLKAVHLEGVLESSIEMSWLSLGLLVLDTWNLEWKNMALTIIDRGQNEEGSSFGKNEIQFPLPGSNIGGSEKMDSFYHLKNNHVAIFRLLPRKILKKHVKF